jgi:antigen flippase
MSEVTGTAEVAESPGPRGIRLAIPNAVGSVVILGSNLASGVLTARLLEPRGRGLVTSTTVLMLVFATLGLIGIRDAVAYTQARRRHRDDELLGTALLLTMTLAFPVTALAVAVSFLIYHHAGASAEHVAVLASLFCPVAMLQAVLCNLVAGRQRYVLLSVLLAISPVLYTVNIVFLHADRDLTPARAVLAFGLSSLPTVVLALWQLSQQSGLGRANRALTGELLRYGVRAQLGTLGDVVSARLDLTIMPAFVAAAAVGHYAVAVSVASLIALLFSNLGPVVLSTAARRDSLDIVVTATRAVIAASLLVAAGLAATAWFLITVVYGHAYQNSYVLMLVLLPGIVAWSANYCVMAGLQSIGQPGLASRAQLNGLVVTVIGLAVLLPTVGAVGAAITSSAAYVTVLVSAVRRLEGTSDVRVWQGLRDLPALRGDLVSASSGLRRRIGR